MIETQTIKTPTLRLRSWIIRMFDARHEFLVNSSIRWVAIDCRESHKIIGGISLTLEDNDFGWINDLWVHEEHRKRGVASDLVMAVEDAVRREEKFIGCCCAVHPHNGPSLNLFDRLGYVHTYTYPSEDGKPGSYLLTKHFHSNGERSKGLQHAS